MIVARGRGYSEGESYDASEISGRPGISPEARGKPFKLLLN